MNNYEDWAQLVAKKLKGEADLIAAIDKDELDDAAATDAFIRAVLEPFLPENFGVGSGRIVDAFGNYSDYLDVVVYNRDFPRIGLRGTHSAYLYESVLAAFAVRAKFIRKTFFDSLNACASLAQLETNIDKAVLVKLAKKNGLKPGPNKRFVHDDPLRTARFELIGRPPAFVFGFSGIKQSFRQLQENIELWMDHRQQDGADTPMKALPAVIATQGCFAWRNAAPLALSNREMLGIGNDDAPVRLIVLQMLYLLNRRLNVTADGYGLKPSLNAYLSQFSAPKFEIGVGDVMESVNPPKAARDTMRFEAAKDHTPVAAAAPEVKPAKPAPEVKLAKPVPEVKPAKPAPEVKSAEPAPAAKEPVAEAPVVAEPVAEQPVVEEPVVAKSLPDEIAPREPSEQAVFDKPSPFSSAPIPATQESVQEPDQAAPASEASSEAAVFDKPSPFVSAPVPPAKEPTTESKRPPAPLSPLGSAPIPPMQEAAPAEPEPAPIPAKEAKVPVPEVIPPKPPVDFDLGAADEVAEDKPEPEEDEFINTVVIPPNAAASSKDATRNSTDAFIARVKEQLSSPEPLPEKGKDPFSSTIPQ